MARPGGQHVLLRRCGEGDTQHDKGGIDKRPVGDVIVLNVRVTVVVVRVVRWRVRQPPSAGAGIAGGAIVSTVFGANNAFVGQPSREETPHCPKKAHAGLLVSGDAAVVENAITAKTEASREGGDAVVMVMVMWWLGCECPTFTSSSHFD
jgi:hypothetical protein